MSARHEVEGGKRLLWAAASDGTDRGLLESAAQAFELRVRVCTPHELSGLFRPAADMVGVELGADSSAGLATIRELHGRAPGTAILAASAHADVELMRAAMQAGACDLLELPLSHEELNKALLRLTQAAARVPAQTVAGQVITVYGVRGGLGTTSLAVNLAFKLAGVTGAETAIVDLDLQRGDVAAFVNVAPAHSIAALATAPGEVDEIFLATAITRHPSGVSVLAAPDTIEEAELVTDREVEVALRLLRNRHAFTVVDTPRAITSAVVGALEESDRILVVSDLSVPSVRAARRMFELLGRLGSTLERSELVVTESVPGPVERKRAVQVIGKEPFAVIPRDDSASSAMNDGVPLNGRPTRLGLTLDALANRLAGLQPGTRPRSLLSRIFPKGARP